MRLTEFWRRMDAHFGASYARSFAADHRITSLGSTVDQALLDGVEAKAIWRAICAEFEVSKDLR
jgi:hypothetical protein